MTEYEASGTDSRAGHPTPGDSPVGRLSTDQLPGASDADDVQPAPEGPSVVVSGEQLVTSTEWVESGHVRIRRRIVSEQRTMEVMVRREELVIEVQDAAYGPVGESYVGTALTGPPVPAPAERREPLVMLLHEEVPELVVRARVHERVTAEVVTTSEVAVRHDRVRREHAVTDTVPPA